MRNILFGLLLVTLFTGVFSYSHWEAGAQTAAPGAGHGFLIDKHLAAGLNCASCHKESPPAKAPDMSNCESCHGTYQQIAAKTASDDPNPHQSHQGEIPCAACHHIHQASVSFCDQCHSFGMKVP